jgi:hypothetical protein
MRAILIFAALAISFSTASPAARAAQPLAAGAEGANLVVNVQHDRSQSINRRTDVPKSTPPRRRINPYHTPGVSRMIRDGRGW